MPLTGHRGPVMAGKSGLLLPTCAGATSILTVAGTLTLTPPARAIGDDLYALAADESTSTAMTATGWTRLEDTPSIYGGNGGASMFRRVATNDANDNLVLGASSNPRWAYMIDAATLATTRTVGEAAGGLFVKGAGSTSSTPSIPAITAPADGYEVMMAGVYIQAGGGTPDVDVPTVPAVAGWGALANSHVRQTANRNLECQSFVRPIGSGAGTGTIGPTFTAISGNSGLNFFGVAFRLILTP